MKTVYAQQNDTLDSIIYRHFGENAGLLEQTLSLNPTLANRPILPLGTLVLLPDAPTQSVRQQSTVQLWS